MNSSRSVIMLSWCFYSINCAIWCTTLINFYFRDTQIYLPAQPMENFQINIHQRHLNDNWRYLDLSEICNSCTIALHALNKSFFSYTFFIYLTRQLKMFSSINSERKDDFLDKAKKARDSRAEEKKRTESVIKMQVKR